MSLKKRKYQLGYFHLRLKAINKSKSNFGFWRKGETPEFPEKTSRCRVENQQTQPTFDARSGNRARTTLVGGECSHHCATPAPYIFALVTEFTASLL